jgi:3-oxoacyl-[acyl-carrier protein] reductase
LKKVLSELSTSTGQKHEYLVADFSFPDQVKEKIESYTKDHVIHILVNNTGGPPAGLASDATLDEFTNAFNSHLICNQIMMQACVPSMKKEKYGRIINVISTSVKIPMRGLGVSNTIRGAVGNWSKTLSLELAPFGITVNNVLPGAIMTGRLESLIKGRAEKFSKSEKEIEDDMIAEIPAGRIGDPHEIAAAAAFLATPAAAYINGINVPVDGGRTGSL